MASDSPDAGHGSRNPSRGRRLSQPVFREKPVEKVPDDLYKQDWWYRTTFKAPAGESYTLEFPGINYHAEIWLNGHKIADNKQVVGMYAAHEFNVTRGSSATRAMCLP